MKPVVTVLCFTVFQVFSAGGGTMVLHAEQIETLQAITQTSSSNNEAPSTTAESGPATPQPLTRSEHLPLYQIECTSVRPVTGITIGESSTGEVCASWTAHKTPIAPGKYYLDGPSGERFLLFVRDNSTGGLSLGIVSEFSNQFLINLCYPDNSFEEKVSSFPRELLNCTFDTAPSCTPGTMLTSPYRDCTRAFAGYVEIVITDAGGTWNVFKQNVINPLKNGPEWSPSDVWIFLFRKLEKGYYAEVRLTTKLCTPAVARKIQGNPLILSDNGRQLNIHYK